MCKGFDLFALRPWWSSKRAKRVAGKKWAIQHWPVLGLLKHCSMVNVDVLHCVVSIDGSKEIETHREWMIDADDWSTSSSGSVDSKQNECDLQISDWFYLRSESDVGHRCWTCCSKENIAIAWFFFVIDLSFQSDEKNGITVDQILPIDK